MYRRPSAAQIEDRIKKSNEKWLNRTAPIKTKNNRQNPFNLGTFGNTEKIKMGLMPEVYQENDRIIEDA